MLLMLFFGQFRSQRGSPAQHELADAQRHGADEQNQIKADTPVDTQRGSQILPGKDSGKYSGIHKLIRSHRTGKRQHVHRDVDRSLQNQYGQQV